MANSVIYVDTIYKDGKSKKIATKGGKKARLLMTVNADTESTDADCSLVAYFTDNCKIKTYQIATDIDYDNNYKIYIYDIAGYKAISVTDVKNIYEIKAVIYDD